MDRVECKKYFSQKVCNSVRENKSKILTLTTQNCYVFPMKEKKKQSDQHCHINNGILKKMYNTGSGDAEADITGILELYNTWHIVL